MENSLNDAFVDEEFQSGVSSLLLSALIFCPTVSASLVSDVKSAVALRFVPLGTSFFPLTTFKFIHH